MTAYTVTLTVSDGDKTNTTSQRIVVGSTPPAASIDDLPLNYNAGDTITFSGSVTIPRTRDQLGNTFYRVSLTVTDSSGLSITGSRRRFPSSSDQTERVVPVSVSANSKSLLASS